MTGNKLFDCTEMFRHGCSFADCADFCRDREHPIHYAKPEIVNSAFACEVFLKALWHYYDIQAQKTHKLKELYEGLPDALKQQIKYHMTDGSSDMWIAPIGIEYLDIISEAFAKWRYSYEYKSLQMPTWFLTSFRDELREVCCQEFYKKTWDEYKGENNGEIG